jgi:hypothetical protein
MKLSDSPGFCHGVLGTGSSSFQISECGASLLLISDLKIGNQLSLITSITTGKSHDRYP